MRENWVGFGEMPPLTGNREDVVRAEIIRYEAVASMDAAIANWQQSIGEHDQSIQGVIVLTQRYRDKVVNQNVDAAFWIRNSRLSGSEWLYAALLDDDPNKPKSIKYVQGKWQPYKPSWGVFGVPIPQDGNVVIPIPVPAGDRRFKAAINAALDQAWKTGTVEGCENGTRITRSI